MRLWVASVDFREDVMASDELMQRIADSYRKMRNTFRYILGNLEGFDPARDSVPFAEMHPLDQYILLRAAEVTKDVREHYDTFTFHRLYQRLKDFCIVDLSAILLRCTERPAVHVGSQISGAPFGADRALAIRRRPGAAAGSGDELYLG